MPHPFSIDKLTTEVLLQYENKTVKTQHNDGAAYQAPNYWILRKIVKILKPSQNDVVYDLGSGMGRVLSVFARRKVKRCVGIEIFESLCCVARKNAMSLRGRKSPIDIVCDDVSKAELCDGTIYFMYNPFGAKTLSDVLASIKRSFATNPRKVTIVYYHSTHEDVLKSCEWFQLVYVFYNATNQRITFWNNASS